MHRNAIFLLVALMSQAAFSLVHAADSDPPNVVFILADDLGWSDTTLYGTTVALSHTAYPTSRRTRDDFHASLLVQSALFAHAGQHFDGAQPRSSRHHVAHLPPSEPCTLTATEDQ